MHKLYIMYGDKPREMAAKILQEMNIGRDIKRLGKKEPLIGIKPNLVVSQPAEWGATTSPELVRGVIGYLHQQGLKNIIILESAWVGDSTEKAFRVCGYEDISREYQVPLVDLKKDRSREFNAAGMKIHVCGKALEADYLINMPVLKAHCQTKLTCALKNLKGCIPDKEKRRFHTLGLHKPIALLNRVLKTDLVVVDGIIGDLTREEGGTPVKMNRVIAGKDPVLVDTYAAELIGYQVEDIEYIGVAAELGVGSTRLSAESLIELNSSRDAPPAGEILASREVEQLSRWIVEDQACSACYGSLVYALKRLKEKGKLERLKQKIHIGQGFKEKEMTGIGVGLCTGKFAAGVAGCPPPAKKIVRFLEEQLDR